MQESQDVLNEVILRLLPSCGVFFGEVHNVVTGF